MAIEFKHGGRTWRADTPEEAIALRKELEDADFIACLQEPPLPSYQENVWTHDTAMELLNGLGGAQRALLKLLYEHDKLTSGQLRRALRLDSEVALAGVLSGLSKQAKKAGVGPSDLYSVTVSWTGKEKTRTFQMSKDFGWAAKELGRPDEWETKT
jgi:hypothetical protein